MYEELIRCLRDCWDDSTGPSCNCDNCLFRDWIVDDGGYTDYTKCVTAMVLAAADAIERLEVINEHYENIINKHERINGDLLKKAKALQSEVEKLKATKEETE